MKIVLLDYSVLRNVEIWLMNFNMIIIQERYIQFQKMENNLDLHMKRIRYIIY